MAALKPTYYDPIVLNSETLGNQPSIRGTDVSLAYIMRFLAERPDVGALLEACPRLTIEDVQAAFSFAAYAVLEPLRSVTLTPAELPSVRPETAGEALLRLARIGGKGPSDLSMRIDDELYGPDA